MKIPVEVWQNGAKWIEKLNTNEALKSVTIDPGTTFPDYNFDNNKWTSK